MGTDIVDVMVDGKRRCVGTGTAPGGGVSFCDPGRWAYWTVVLNTSERWAVIEVKVGARLSADQAQLLAATIAHVSGLAAEHNAKADL